MKFCAGQSRETFHKTCCRDNTMIKEDDRGDYRIELVNNSGMVCSRAGGGRGEGRK